MTTEEAREAAGRNAIASFRLPGQYVSTREEDAFFAGHRDGFDAGVVEGIRQAREAVAAVVIYGDNDHAIGRDDSLAAIDGLTT